MRFRKKGFVSPEIPTASMADIAFLLIVFFMVTAVFSITRGLDYELPKKEEVPKAIEREEAVYIKVFPDGSYEVDRRPMELKDLLGYLAPKLTEGIGWPDKPVMIHTDPMADYGAMLAAYDTLRTAKEESHGFWVRKISIPSLAELYEIQQVLGEF
ncbi:MAG: biopolymer transporter ExbD [Acidobacteriota bacterium]|nr:MAG: biopolymer transporter ExbD [Acidobacteriota bacterium]